MDPMAPSPPAPAGGDADADVDATGVAAAAQNAIGLAAQDPALAGAFNAARVVTLTFNADGSVDVDVDGTAATVAAADLGLAPATDDAAPPPAPPAG